jgi:hypothetical protein
VALNTAATSSSSSRPPSSGTGHERRSPGVNHLAFWAGSPDDLDTLVAEAPVHGRQLLFADRHPFAGGADRLAPDGGQHAGAGLGDRHLLALARRPVAQLDHAVCKAPAHGHDRRHPEQLGVLELHTR